MLAYALGMMSVSEWGPEHLVDFVPADCVTSSVVLGAAAAGGPLRALPEPIIHCCSSATNPLTNRMVSLGAHSRAWPLSTGRGWSAHVGSGAAREMQSSQRKKRKACAIWEPLLRCFC